MFTMTEVPHEYNSHDWRALELAGPRGGLRCLYKAVRLWVMYLSPCCREEVLLQLGGRAKFCLACGEEVSMLIGVRAPKTRGLGLELNGRDLEAYGHLTGWWTGDLVASLEAGLVTDALESLRNRQAWDLEALAADLRGKLEALA